MERKQARRAAKDQAIRKAGTDMENMKMKIARTDEENRIVLSGKQVTLLETRARANRWHRVETLQH